VVLCRQIRATGRPIFSKYENVLETENCCACGHENLVIVKVQYQGLEQLTVIMALKCFTLFGQREGSRSLYHDFNQVFKPEIVHLVVLQTMPTQFLVQKIKRFKY